MKELSYRIVIRASRERVWDDMLDPVLYREWAKAFSAGSRYEGEWKEGEYITFTDPSLGGTKAHIDDLVRPERIHATHVNIISKDGIEDTESESARKWIGCTETYELREVGGGTELRISVSTHEDYEKMFNDCWPKALELLKDICERE
jgi:uncharacterized protein YndB with AHSA1/START domain